MYRRLSTHSILLAVSVSVAVSAQTLPSKLCPPCAPVTAIQKSELPADALKKVEWAIAQDTGVRAPWRPLDRMPGTDRLAGEGAVIVQIDTGVTPHPLLGGPDFSFVDVHAADDLFGAGHRNIDPLLGGFLRNAGHGTKTSSVIVGRATEELPVSGIAQGAHLVPIRATQSVMLFPKKLGELDADANRISRGLYTAARGSGFGLRLRPGERVDVISMSLGTVPETPGLCQAVKAATDAGIIVVVAAGNQVKHTVYPAKCPTAIAVAGTTISDTPWSGSAGSREVAIAAPAEAVWTAAVVNGESSCIEASSGTSFATALVAGLAAEWSVRHPLPKDPAVIKANPELLTGRYKVFRDALRETATRWKNPAWQEKYGAGIVNATALFK